MIVSLIETHRYINEGTPIAFVQLCKPLGLPNDEFYS